ncbi:MAG: hypothetical protein OHK0024_18100 [Thalassobaculales bacterium]
MLYDRRMTFRLMLLGLLAALIGNLAFWYAGGRPVPLADAATEKVACASYAPYRRGESPLRGDYPKPENIAEDLQVIAGMIGCVRTYSAVETLALIPDHARNHGMSVMLGAWISGTDADNRKEIASVVATANRHPETVKMVIVGNEVLLRRDQPAAQLAAYIREVKRQVRQPVTYADVWEFWLQNKELAREVDVVTVHLLPYWEDEPIGIDHAIAHVRDIYHKVRAAFPDKPILIGEVGWPSAGRQREGAAPGLVAMARFTREFLSLSVSEGFDYNLVEAFDQPWKRANEGTVGGQWGLFDAERLPKFSLRGGVSENPEWARDFALSSGLGLLLLAAARGAGPLPGRLALALPVVAVLFAAIVTAAAENAYVVHHTWLWAAVTVAGLAGLLVLAVMLLRRLLAPARGPSPGLLQALGLLRPIDGRYGRGDWWFAVLNAGFGLGAAVCGLALVFNPRYRDFPIEMFAIPAAGLLALALFERRPDDGDGREEAVLAGILAAAAAGSLLAEGLHNHQAIAWAGTLSALALGWGLRASRAGRRGSGTAPG